MIHTSRHVKAHREREQIEALEGVERMFAVANVAAVRYAKDGLSLHPSPSPGFSQELDSAGEQARGLDTS
eukprot:8720305-Pyramimonas_sp.AAC.1